MAVDWSALSAHPAMQSIAVPLVVATIFTGAMRLRGDRFGGKRGAGLAIGLGFLAIGSIPVALAVALALLADTPDDAYYL